VNVLFVALAVKLPAGARLSQVLVVQLCSDIWAVALVLVWAVTVRVWDAGRFPPAAALKVNVEELKLRGPAAAPVTESDTFQMREPRLESTSTTLLYVPAVSPAGFTERVSTEGVICALRLAVSQVAESVCSVKDTVVGLKTLYCTAAGALPPIWYVKGTSKVDWAAAGAASPRKSKETATTMPPTGRDLFTRASLFYFARDLNE
jgi:hypothetical protein